MAERPVFVPNTHGSHLVDEVLIDFKWAPGMAPIQKEKNIKALHENAARKGLKNLLEISSKSEVKVGRRLSAFSLQMPLPEGKHYLESIYQSSKVFEKGGPFYDILSKEPIRAKKDERLKSSGHLASFRFQGEDYPLFPKNAFYDWLYIRTLAPHIDWIMDNVHYDGFTDIEFNPKKSVNCQARAFAELIALQQRGLLKKCTTDFYFFAKLLKPI